MPGLDDVMAQYAPPPAKSASAPPPASVTPSPKPSPKSLDDVMAQYAAPAKKTQETKLPESPRDTQKPTESLLHRAGRETIGALPAIGATAGAGLGTTTDFFTGPLGTIGGAAIGSGIGEAARQTVAHWFPDLAKAPGSTADALNQTAQQIAFGGATEAAGPYINQAFEKFLGPVIRPVKKGASDWLQKSARRSLIKVMDPTDKIAKGYALEGANRLLERPGFGSDGYVSATRGGLEQKAAARATVSGKALDQAESKVAGDLIVNQTQPRPYTKQAATQIDEFNSALQNYRDKMYMPPSNSPAVSPAGPVPGGFPNIQEKYGADKKLDVFDKIKNIIDNEMTTTTVNAQGQPVGVEPGTGNLSRGSLRIIKQDLDQAVKDSEGFARNTLVAGGAVEPALASKIRVEKDMGNILRGILNKDKPDIAKLNAEFHLWRTVQQAMSPATLAGEFQKTATPWQSFWKERAGLWAASALATAPAYGVAGVHGAEAVGVLFAVGELMKQPVWRTISAASKNDLANYLAKGQLENAAKLAVRLGVQRNSGSTPPPGVAPASPASEPNPYRGSKNPYKGVQ